MTTNQPGSRIAKQQKWEQHVRDWEDSGLSQKDYCESHALPLQSFGYWKRKLKKVPSVQPRFYPLSIPVASISDSAKSCSGLHLHLNNDRFCVEINTGFSAELLKELVLTLEQL